MSGYVNKVVLIGNVGKDPLISNSRYGKPIARFSLATSKRWKDESGERMESTVWHNVVVFNETIAKEVERTIRKGSYVYVEGELANRKWTDNDGIERWITEIVVSRSLHRAEAIDGIGGNIEGGGNRAPAPDDMASYGNTRPAGQQRPASDDEVPF